MITRNFLAENELGSAWTEGPIAVVAQGTLPTDGEAPDFLEPVRPVSVNVGQTAVLVGKVSGRPTPTIKWFKGDVEIDAANTRYEISSASDGTQTLRIRDATLEDAGECRCSAHNIWGEVWSDATLTVKGEP